jgi:hypothetical protein
MEEQKFKKESFWSLLQSNKITIPIIQRSYTQGGRGVPGQKDEAKNKGVLFLHRLLEALLDDNPIELDFIYGSLAGNALQPLDGQQRLTTLFLLHWYIAQKEKKLTEDAIKILQRFSYETRISSRYFCEALCQFSLNDYCDDNIVETIKNQPWFILSWANDPSVLSMFGMLEEIDKRLRGEKSALWEKITQPQKSTPITFFYTPLESFNLTDDLYIKMNARGKQLTGFENAKAAFNKRIDEEGWDNDKKSPQEKFGHKIDTLWTDLFWKFRNKENKIDMFLLRFISASLVCCYAQGNNHEHAQKLFDYPLEVSPDYLNSESYSYLYNCFEVFNRNEITDHGAIQFDIVFWFGRQQPYTNLRALFELFISKEDASANKSITWQERVVFYGLYLYLKNNDIINIDKLADWLIFIRNLITNGTVDSFDTFRSAQNRLVELNGGTTDIYAYLFEQPDSILGGFSQNQMREEMQKAKIYKNSPEAKKILQELENHRFCRGKLEFILYCLEITDSVADIEKLKKLQTVIFANFKEDNLSNKFKRAMFTIDDFYIEAGWGWCGALGEHKYYIISTIEDLREYYAFGHKKRENLKEILLKLLDKSSDEIIISFKKQDNMPNWKWRIITESELLDEHCNSKHFTIPYDDEAKHCYLLMVRNPWEGHNDHYFLVE